MTWHNTHSTQCQPHLPLLHFCVCVLAFLTHTSSEMVTIAFDLFLTVFAGFTSFSLCVFLPLFNLNWPISICAPTIFEYGCCVHMKSLEFICTHVIIIMSREKLRMNEKRVWHEKKTHFVSTTTDLPPAWRRNKKWNTNRRTAYKIIKRSYINENILNRLIQWAYYNNII